jgi:hypothetical protein
MSLTRPVTPDVAECLRDNAERNPEVLRKILWDDGWLYLALESLKTGLMLNQRNARREYWQLIRMLDPPQAVNVLVAIWPQLGVQNESEARSLIRAAKNAEMLDEDALWQRFLTFGRDYLTSHPEARSDLKQLESHAEAE